MIDYKKNLTEGPELNPFFSQREPCKFLYEYVILMNYNLQGLENSLVDKIETELKNINFEVIRSDWNLLNVSGLDRFSLNLNATLTDFNGNKIKERINGLLKTDQEVMIGTKKNKGLFNLGSTPIYKEIPQVNIDGQIDYEDLKANNVSPVLEILKKLGYRAEIISTNKQIQNVLEKIAQSSYGSSGCWCGFESPMYG